MSNVTLSSVLLAGHDVNSRLSPTLSMISRLTRPPLLPEQRVSTLAHHLLHSSLVRSSSYSRYSLRLSVMRMADISVSESLLL